MNRRDFLLYSSLIFSGVLAPIPLLPWAGAARPARRGKAKSLVFLHMVGGPSQIELFDYKPELIKRHGTRISNFSSEKGQVGGVLMKPISSFARHGGCGRWVSDLFPMQAELVDDLCFIKSMTCSSLDHYLAQLEMVSGSVTPGNPSAGAWIGRALGPGSQALPQSVIMTDPLGTPRIGPEAWAHAGLPEANSTLTFAEISRLRQKLEGLAFGPELQQDLFLRYLHRMNALGGSRDSGRSELFSLVYHSRKALLETFRKMEPEYSRDRGKLYGVSAQGQNHFADQLMFARELVKLEVPFIQVFCGNEDDPTSWDHHFEIEDIRSMARKVDRPIHAFLTELKREGLLDQTLVVWAGEFGRLPMIDTGEVPAGKMPRGRGHNNRAGTIWLAGAGVKKGFSFGETDELSLQSVQDVVEVGDLWATLLQLMGIDHQALQYVRNGVEMRFTRKTNRVIEEVLA